MNTNFEKGSGKMFFSLFGGLGKRRSKFGKFLDQHSITQQEFAKESHVSKSTISRLCDPEGYSPSMKNANKIIKTLRKYDPNIDYDDFWDL